MVGIVIGVIVGIVVVLVIISEVLAISQSTTLTSKEVKKIHRIISNCLIQARNKQNTGNRKPMPQHLSPTEMLAESHRRGRDFEKTIEDKLFSKLSRIKGLEMNPQLTFASRDRCDFLLSWKDLDGVARAIILECKHSDSDSYRAYPRVREGIRQLFKYKSCIEENVDWKVELLVVLTDFPLSTNENIPAYAYEKEDVLVLNANTMLDVFIEEFISWHKYTITPSELLNPPVHLESTDPSFKEGRDYVFRKYSIPIPLKKTLINKCLKLAKTRSSEAYKNPISSVLNPQKIEEETRKRMLECELGLKRIMDEELSQLPNLKINLQYGSELSDMCNFSIEWQDMLNRTRIVLIDYKYSIVENPNSIELVEQGIKELHKFRNMEKQSGTLRVDLLVLLTNFPWDNVEPAELRNEVLILNMYSMFESFLHEFKKWYKFTVTTPFSELPKPQEDTVLTQ